MCFVFRSNLQMFANKPNSAGDLVNIQAKHHHVSIAAVSISKPTQAKQHLSLNPALQSL